MPLIPTFRLISIRSPSTKLKILRIFNILTILLVFFSNAYFAIFPRPSSGDISDKHPTYFTPSLAFVGIFWVILYVLQFGFAFYAQFNNSRVVQEAVENDINWLFSLSNLFMCGWLYFWMTENFVLSEFCVLLILFSTSITQSRLIVRHIPNKDLIRIYSNSLIHIPLSTSSMLRRNFIPVYIVSYIHIPFSMFSAYSWLALFHNGFIIFTFDFDFDFNFEKLEYAALGLACVMAMIGFAWGFAGVFSKGRRDVIFSATIAWSLLGVGFQQRETSLPIAVTCGVLAFVPIVVSLFIIIKTSLKLIRIICKKGKLLSRPQSNFGSITNS